MTGTHQNLDLTPTQRVIWYGQSLHPEAPIYNTAYAFRFLEPIDPDAFSRAHGRLIRSTDSFRMTIAQLNGQPQIHCSDSSPGELALRDVSSLSDLQFKTLLKEETSRMLDLSTCPWSSTLFERADGHFVWHLLHHHLLTDGIGFQAVLRRLGSYYQEELNPKACNLTDAAPPFGEWISRQSHQRQSKTKLESGDSQNSRLYSALPPTGDPAGERCTSSFDHHSRSSIERLADDPRFASFSRELSINLILLTSTIALLTRIDQRSKVSIGIANHGRTSPEEMEISGLLISIRPLRVTIESGDTFTQLHEKVRDDYFLLAGEIGDQGSGANQAQDYDVTFNFLTSDMTDFAGIPVDAEWLYPDCHESANRWRIHITTPVEADWNLACDFNNEAFSPRGKRVAMNNLFATMAAFAANPDLEIQSFSLTGSNDPDASILVGRESDIGDDVNLWRKFESIARSNAPSVAISADGEILTYGDLLESAEHQSEILRKDSIEPGEIIPIIGRRSPSMIRASLAAMRAGGAFLPIDSRLPKIRIDTIISDSEGTSPVFTEDQKPMPQAGDVRASREADTAYVIYTSGTTGVPNGVAVGHRPVTNLLKDMERRAPLEPGSRCMWWTAVNFDLSIYEVFSALLFGHSLHIPSDEIHLNPERLFEWIAENDINSAYLPPFMLDSLNTWLDNHQGFPLRRLLVGVEPIQQELLVSLANKVDGLRVVNGYGPTEATVCTTFYDIDPGFIGKRRTPIGEPISGNRCYILDQNLNLMPRGTIGELHIAGTGLARGYWRRPELNKLKFIPDPFHEGPDGGLMYKSGDLVRLSDEDQLEFIGRIDSQINLRGQRVEPAEIEQSMAAHPDIRRCLAGIETISGQEQLVCYYTSLSAISADSLFSHASSLLPFPLIPKHFHHFNEFPTTSNGKVDTEALIRLAATEFPKSSRLDQPRELVTPEGPVEEHLMNLWIDRFGTQEISTHDSFFQLGGTSLDSMEITVQLCKDFDLDIPLHIIFTKPTIVDLSAEIERRIEEEIEGLDDEQTDEMLDSISAQ